eukprot:4002761-Pyramimonas_sp.AAC.1
MTSAAWRSPGTVSIRVGLMRQGMVHATHARYLSCRGRARYLSCRARAFFNGQGAIARVARGTAWPSLPQTSQAAEQSSCI